MKIIIWLLIWTIGGMSLEYFLKINIGWKIVPIQIFCATMGMIAYIISIG